MRVESYGGGFGEAIKTDRQIRLGTDKIVVRKFGAVAKVLWPTKTAATLAALAGSTPRTAERWLSGEFDPPISIAEAVLHETFRRSSNGC